MSKYLSTWCSTSCIPTTTYILYFYCFCVRTTSTQNGKYGFKWKNVPLVLVVWKLKLSLVLGSVAVTRRVLNYTTCLYICTGNTVCWWSGLSKIQIKQSWFSALNQSELQVVSELSTVNTACREFRFKRLGYYVMSQWHDYR